MKTKDFPSVKAAKTASFNMFAFYRTMKRLTTKPVTTTAPLEAQNRHDDDDVDAECRNLLMEENDALRARITELEDFVRDTAENYDCDKDAHTHGTRCRTCEATKLLNKK